MFYDFIYLAKGFRMRPKVRSTLNHQLTITNLTQILLSPAIVFLQNLRANFLSCLPSRNYFTINFLTPPSKSLHFWQPCFFPSSVWSYDIINSQMESSLKFHQNFTEILILFSEHTITFVHTFLGLCICKK